MTPPTKAAIESYAAGIGIPSPATLLTPDQRIEIAGQLLYMKELDLTGSFITVEKDWLAFEKSKPAG